MKELISLSFQSVIITFIASVLSASWTILVSPIRASSRRDKKIFGHNLILIAFAFLGIIAFAYDQLKLGETIATTHLQIYVIAGLCIMLWIICMRIVRFLLFKPFFHTSRLHIMGVRYSVNLIGISMVVMCRFLLTDLLAKWPKVW